MMCNVQFCIMDVVGLRVASASSGSKARHPGCVGPLASPAGPHPPKDQRGGAVVPAEGLHAT